MVHASKKVSETLKSLCFTTFSRQKLFYVVLWKVIFLLTVFSNPCYFRDPQRMILPEMPVISSLLWSDGMDCQEAAVCTTLICLTRLLCLHCNRAAALNCPVRQIQLTALLKGWDVASGHTTSKGPLMGHHHQARLLRKPAVGLQTGRL